MSFIRYKPTIEEGDTAIVFLGRQRMFAITVARGRVFQAKFGIFPHDDMLGKPYGTKFYSTNRKGWIHVLHPTPELWTLTLPHRTQILYSTDISLITLMLDLKPGSIVVESGTGSGSLSHAIVRTIAPSGHLYTFEFHQQRCEVVREEFKAHGMEECVTTEFRDVCKDGFGMESVADAVFLDLPRPYEAITHARDVMKTSGGRLCSFSPCVEQVQATCEEMRQHGFVDLKTVECLLRTFEIRPVQMQTLGVASNMDDDLYEIEPKAKLRKEEEKAKGLQEDVESDKKCQDLSAAENSTTNARYLTVSPNHDMPGHTGYLTFATLHTKT
jgi:tRNA (adenine57-N1/adenine58-N1)-methyltransferase